MPAPRNWIAPVGFGAAELEKRGALEVGNCESCLFDANLHTLIVSKLPTTSPNEPDGETSLKHTKPIDATSKRA